MKRQLVFFGIVFIPASALIVVTAMIAMALVLRSDVATLDKRARQALRLQKTLHAEIVAIKDDLAVLEREPMPAVVEEPAAAAETPVAVAAGAARRNGIAAAAGRAVKVAAAMAAPECIFKSGDPYGLADCIRSQQDSIGKTSTHSKYR